MAVPLIGISSVLSMRLVQGSRQFSIVTPGWAWAIEFCDALCTHLLCSLGADIVLLPHYLLQGRLLVC